MIQHLGHILVAAYHNSAERSINNCELYSELMMVMVMMMMMMMMITVTLVSIN